MRISMMLGVLSTITTLTLGGLAYAAAAPEGDTTKGEELFSKCTPCHGDKPSKMVGKPVADLVSKMEGYQSGIFSSTKVVNMQKLLRPMSPQNVLDIATYLNKM